MLEDRRLLASLAPIANFSVPAQQGYALPLDGSGTADCPDLQHHPDLRHRRHQREHPDGPFWTINVQYTDPTNAANGFSGALVFQLFQTLTPNTVSQIEAFTNDGYYTGKNFTRITDGFPTANDAIVQAGAPNTNGSGSSGQPNTPFLNENAQSLALTGTYQLAMANAGVNTSLSNRVPGGEHQRHAVLRHDDRLARRRLGYGYTIFGQLLSGQATLTQMTQIPRQYNPDLNDEIPCRSIPLTMSSLSLSSTNPTASRSIDTTQALPGDSATFQVTATDPTDGSTLTRSFIVTAGTYAGPTDPAIDFKPFADLRLGLGGQGELDDRHPGGPVRYPDTNVPRDSELLAGLATEPRDGLQLQRDHRHVHLHPPGGLLGPRFDPVRGEGQRPAPADRTIADHRPVAVRPRRHHDQRAATVAPTVTPKAPLATPTITWPNPAEIIYGTALSNTQLDAKGSVPGTFTYSPAPGTVLKAGAGQTLSVTFTPTDTADYVATSATVSINVARATPTITWATPAGLSTPRPWARRSSTRRRRCRGRFPTRPRPGRS